MKVLSSQQMREVDAQTIIAEGTTRLALMERAATAVTEVICRKWTKAIRVVVFAGAGGNGGDGLAVSRLLAAKGYAVEACLFNMNDKLSPECQANRDRLVGTLGVEFHEIGKQQFDPPELSGNVLVVDALFGTGLSKTLTGGFAALVRYINSSAAPVVSIDIPSGLLCEDNSHNVKAHIIRATLTLTFQMPKLALLMADNAPYFGEVEVLDIGLSPEAIARQDSPFYITEPQDIIGRLLPRSPFAHKGTFGHGLLIAGRYGMAGAAILAAQACLRAGVGKLSVHTPLMNNNILQTAVPEAILSHDRHDEIFSTAVDTSPYSAVAIGPGIGQAQSTELAFIEQVRHTHRPLVIDADGLNILSTHKGWMQQVPAEAILTPHPQEMQRLGMQSVDSYTTLTEAMAHAKKYQQYVVLKSHYTAICTPGGKVYFNTTGNAGMATAGSGDVLTGILLALLSQNYNSETACLLGVYLHGLAGDIAAETLGQECLTAHDLVAFLPYAFKSLRKQANNTAE